MNPRGEPRRKALSISNCDFFLRLKLKAATLVCRQAHSVKKQREIKWVTTEDAEVLDVADADATVAVAAVDAMVVVAARDVTETAKNGFR